MPKAAKTTKKAMSKTELVGRIADATELTKRDVSAVLDSLSEQIGRSLGRRGPGMFTLPGLVKIEKKRVPASKARKGVPNPFKPGDDGHRGQAGLHQGQGAAPQEPQGDGLRHGPGLSTDLNIQWAERSARPCRRLSRPVSGRAYIRYHGQLSGNLFPVIGSGNHRIHTNRIYTGNGSD